MKDSTEKQSASEATADFWRKIPLKEMSREQWAALCDGCGLCCLEKLADEEENRIYITGVACRHLDIHTCRCKVYPTRDTVNRCIRLTVDNLKKYHWLPDTCAYRLLLKGKDLPPWHHLVCHDPEAVHEAGISAREKAIPGEYVDPEDLEAYIVLEACFKE